MSTDEEVNKAIARVNKLKDWVGLPVKLYRQGNSLYSIGTFPAKDGISKPKQAKYPLGLKATLAMIPIARDIRKGNWAATGVGSV